MHNYGNNVAIKNMKEKGGENTLCGQSTQELR